jgi:hypothetical protein
MGPSDDTRFPDRNGDGEVDPDEDPGEELEARIEQANRPFGSSSFGTTAEEQMQGDSLEERLRQELPSRPPDDVQFAIQDVDGPDDEAELIATGSYEHDPYVSPEEAAMTVRDQAPGGVDHPPAPGSTFDELEPPDPEDAVDED